MCLLLVNFSFGRFFSRHCIGKSFKVWGTYTKAKEKELFCMQFMVKLRKFNDKDGAVFSLYIFKLINVDF